MYSCTIGKDKKKYYFKNGKRISIKNIPKDKIPNCLSKTKKIEKAIKISSPIKISKQKEYTNYLSSLNIYILREVLKNLEPFEIKELCTVNKELNEKCKNEIIKKLLKEKERPYFINVEKNFYIVKLLLLFKSKEFKNFKDIFREYIINFAVKYKVFYSTEDINRIFLKFYERLDDYMTATEKLLISKKKDYKLAKILIKKYFSIDHPNIISLYYMSFKVFERKIIKRFIKESKNELLKYAKNYRLYKEKKEGQIDLYTVINRFIDSIMKFYEEEFLKLFPENIF